MEAIYPNSSAIWQFLIFIAALIVVKYFILNPVSAVLRGRDEKIEGAEQEAAKLAEESQQLDATYLKRIREARAQAKLDRAEQRSQALTEEKEILDRGREEAHKKLSAIEEEIRAESEAAQGRLKTDAERISIMLTEKLLGRPVS